MSEHEVEIAELNERREKAERAAQKIAALMFVDLDVEITTAQVRSFLKGRWDRIAPLAHLVHEAPDTTKWPKA